MGTRWTPSNDAAVRRGPTNRFLRAIEWRLRHGWFSHMVRGANHFQAFVFGPYDRVSVGKGCEIRGITLNTMSGRIEIGDYSFVGHDVRLLTGTHDPAKRNRERFELVPDSGRDIIIGEGVWLASNITVLGPCRIGDHAVIAAGSVVTHDVEAETIVAGVPARFVRKC